MGESVDVLVHRSSLYPPGHGRSPLRPVARRLFAIVVAALCAVLFVPVAASAEPADTGGGPGKWYKAQSGGPKPGSQAWYYEQQIKGPGHEGEDYWVPYPETRDKPGFDIDTWIPKRGGRVRDGVAFDNYNSVSGELEEAKGPGYAYPLDPTRADTKKGRNVRSKLLAQFDRQKRAASSTNTPIRAHFAETGAEEEMNEALDTRGIRTRVTEPVKPTLFGAPGSPADPLAQGVQRGAIPGIKPGGIDFSTIRLNYLSADDSGDSRGIKYSYKADAAPQGTGDVGNARDASDAFFVWLELDSSKFWVNLNPSQPDKIIDPALARTDVGRVLLESDLQLKKEMTALQDPTTPTGARFWRRIYQGSDPTHCLSYRTWISPKPASVRQTGDSLYILDAPLQVQTALQYITDPKTGKRTCPGQTKEQAAYAMRAIREVLVPEAEKAVNGNRDFMSLRRVYLSRVAAEWYKDVSANHDTMYRGLIGQGVLGPWVSRQPWDPKEVYRQYLDIYDASEGSIVIGGTTYRFTYGGVDFSRAPAEPVSQQQFTQQHPHLPKTVDRSIDRPTRDPADDGTWAGGTTTVAKGGASPTPSSPGRAGGGGLPDTGTPLWAAILAGVILFGIGAVLVVAFRRRRLRRHAA